MISTALPPTGVRGHRPSPVSRRTAVAPAHPSDAGGLTLADVMRVVLTLAVVGAVIAGLQLATSPTSAGSSAESVLSTPYGLVAVGSVTVSAAVPAANAGMVGTQAPSAGHSAHTGAGATPDGVQVNVPLTLHNRGDEVVSYRPQQFRLVADGQEVTPQDSALLTGELRPEAAVSLRLTFALPAAVDGARLRVDGASPSDGLELQLPGASVPGAQMTSQEQATTPAHTSPANTSSANTSSAHTSSAAKH